MKSTKVATVIVTWNKLPDICSLLEDISQLNLQNIKLDTYVVDNASTDGTQAYLEQYYSSKVKVLQTGRNLGGSGGFSYGLEIVSQLDYDYIWLLDNDVRLDSLALDFLTKTLETCDKIGLVGSQIRKLQQPNVIQEIGSFVDYGKAHLKTNFGNCSVESAEAGLKEQPHVFVDVCAAASLLVRRVVVQQLGVFEDYFLHFDDVEWCLRAKKAGWLVAVNPDSIVWHHSPDFKYRPWINYYDDRNLCYCWQKHQPNLLLKRIIVRSQRLIYYAVTGQYFLAEISIAGFQDFIKGIRGKMPEGTLNYVEYSLENLVKLPSKVFVQSAIYQDSMQRQVLEEMEAEGKITPWYPSKSSLTLFLFWLFSWIWKPNDVALVTCHSPDLHAVVSAKQVYCFTGTGYIPISINPLALAKAVASTVNQMWQVYWQVHKVQQLQTPEKMSAQLLPLVSIVICTADRPLCLKKALKSLEASQYQKFEVIVIDASLTANITEEIHAVDRSRFSLKVLKVESRNISYSRNMGIKLASGSIVAFFDDDAIPPAEWIEKLLLTYAQYGEKCAAVGGLVRDSTHPAQPLQFCRGITNLLSETIAVRSTNAVDHNQPNGFWFNGLMGTNASFRKDLLEKINGYDEFFDYFLDETDICLRLIQAGYEIHYADVVVDHYPQPSHNRIDQKHLTCWYSLAKNTTYFALKHGFKKVPLPIFITRLTLLLIHRCLLRVLRLKFTHNLSNSVLMKYVKQCIEGFSVGWIAGLNFHRVGFAEESRADFAEENR